MGKYCVKKTISKSLRQALIWVLPQIMAYVNNSSAKTMTIAATASYIITHALDYLKHGKKKTKK